MIEMTLIRQVLLAPYSKSQQIRAYIAWKLERWDVVIGALEGICRYRLDDEDIRLGLANAYVQVGRWVDALARFEELGSTQKKTKRSAARWYNHALTLYELGRDRECEELLNHSMEDWWGEEAIRKSETLLISAMIRPLGAFCSPDEAAWNDIIEQLEKMKDRGFGSDHLAFWLGTAYLRTGRWSDALAELQSVGGILSNAAEKRRLTLNTAWALCKLGRLREAERLIDDCVDSTYSEAEQREVSRLLSEIATSRGCV
jgi:tetratricopeptide (TPR) repeat protein